MPTLSTYKTTNKSVSNCFVNGLNVDNIHDNSSSLFCADTRTKIAENISLTWSLHDGPLFTFVLRQGVVDKRDYRFFNTFRYYWYVSFNVIVIKFHYCL